MVVDKALREKLMVTLKAALAQLTTSDAPVIGVVPNMGQPYRNLRTDAIFTCIIRLPQGTSKPVIEKVDLTEQTVFLH